jgi:hypothetical protein
LVVVIVEAAQDACLGNGMVGLLELIGERSRPEYFGKAPALVAVGLEALVHDAVDLEVLDDALSCRHDATRAAASE